MFNATFNTLGDIVCGGGQFYWWRQPESQERTTELLQKNWLSWSVKIGVERTCHVRGSNLQPQCCQASDTVTVKLLRPLGHQGPILCLCWRISCYGKYDKFKALFFYTHLTNPKMLKYRHNILNCCNSSQSDCEVFNTL